MCTCGHACVWTPAGARCAGGITGVPQDCTAITDNTDNACTKYNGCSWDETGAACTGSHSCVGIGDEGTCTNAEHPCGVTQPSFFQDMRLKGVRLSLIHI